MGAAAREHLVGIDEGTTGVRAVVARADGALVGAAYREIDQSFPRPGWVEHDPERLWLATREIAARAIDAAGIAPGDVAALGLANQRGSAVAFRDGDAGAIGPVLGWQDQRTTARCAELLAAGVFASPLTAATKWEWLVRERAAGRRAGLRLGTIDTWLAHRLSGGAAHVTDHSNASCSGLYGWPGGGWDERAAAALGLDPSWLPAIADSSALVAETEPAAFGARVPIAALSGDQHAAMYGLACLAPGSAKLTLGTSGMMTMNAGREPRALGAAGPGTYPLVLWSLDGQRHFALEGTTVTAGAAAQWLRDGLGIAPSLEAIEPLARGVGSSEGVWFVPAFQGLGTPHLEAAARATIGGLSRAATRGHVARALLEGIAWRCREVLDALVANLSARPGVLRVDGGAAANGLLLELLADALGIAVEVPASLDSAALGAALLAGRAVGLVDDGALAGRWRAARRIEPSIGEDERAAGLDRWRRRVALVREAGS